MIYFGAPSEADCYNLAANLRPHDRDEMQAARGGITGADLWEACQSAHDVCVVCAHNWDLICIFGVSPHSQQGVGVPWLLGTPLLDRHMLSLCKHAKDTLADWHRTYHTLTNYTDLRNRRVIMWLRWLGFAFNSTVGLNGHTFVQFVRHV